MKILFCLLAAAALLCGCKPDEPVKTAAENENEHLQTLLREECTNQVVGITKIMSSYLDYDPKTAVTNWHAGASVEYINHFGGIDRTNLHLVFRLLTDQWSTNIYCGTDFDYMLQEDLAKFHRELDRAGK